MMGKKIASVLSLRFMTDSLLAEASRWGNRRLGGRATTSNTGYDAGKMQVPTLPLTVNEDMLLTSVFS
jgi:hypothetical protein